MHYFENIDILEYVLQSLPEYLEDSINPKLLNINDIISRTS